MRELRGKAVADAHKEALQQQVRTLEAKGITLGIAMVLVGDDHGAHMYANFLEKTSKNTGFHVTKVVLPETATQEEVVQAVRTLNEDEQVHGILPLMPMPKHIDTEMVIEALDPTKDVDGLTTYNIGLVTAGKGGFAPCTAKACMAILHHYDIPVAGQHVVVVGRSAVIGKPVALMALAENGTVSICHSHTANLADHVRQGDIVVAAAGRAHMITKDMLKPGAVVIDVGINDLDGKTVGDVDYDNVLDVVDAITPVPGGIGAVTTTMMLEAVCEAYYARNGHC